MAKRAKRSLESQIEDAKSQSVRRWKHAEATGAEADVQRQRDREHRHEYMRRYRERLRVRVQHDSTHGSIRARYLQLTDGSCVLGTYKYLWAAHGSSIKLIFIVYSEAISVVT